MQYKATRCEQPVLVPGFCCTADAVLRELDTDPVREVLQVPTTASAYLLKDCRVKEHVQLLICNRLFVVTFVNGSRFFQLILQLNRKKTGSSFVNMTTSTMFDGIFLFCLSIMDYGLHNRKLTMSQDYHVRTRLGFCTQPLLKGWKELLDKALSTAFSKTMAPYALFDNSICQFKVLIKASDGQ